MNEVAKYARQWIATAPRSASVSAILYVPDQGTKAERSFARIEGMS